ncbi:MAG: leucine-rich repeat domain-containing protein [Alistipes sp.]|nr:leucine-rich repeat domain-containing protein [Alistipes sp.]
MKRLLTILTLLFILSAYGCTHTIYFDKKPIDNNTEDTTDKENNSEDSSSSEDNKNDDIIVIPNNEIWYTSTDGKIVVPSTSADFGAEIVSMTYTDGKGIIEFDDKITKIGYGAFADGNRLTSITIPDSVTIIEGWAFGNCSNLSQVYCEPVTPPTLQYDVFKDTNLSAIYVYKESVDWYKAGWAECADKIISNGKNSTSTTTILYTTTDNSFIDLSKKLPVKSTSQSNGLKSIVIHGKLQFLPEELFLGCDKLKQITIPNSITSIGRNAFYSCRGLTSITIPDSVTEIGDYAFCFCDGLTSVTIPESVTKIEDNPFKNCENLAEFNGKFASEDGRCLIVDGVLKSFAPAGITTYNIPNGVTEIGGNAFSGCDGLTSVIIPGSVTEIGVEAFSSCHSLTSIIIPESVTCIRYGTFQNCYGLTSITIPDSVTEIGNNPFEFCKNLAEFNGKFASEDGRCLIIDGVLNSFAPAGLTTYSIPNNVTEIGSYAFWYCDGLTSITIPDSVTKIRNCAFWCCSGLTSITIPDSVTEIEHQTFSYCSGLTSVFCERTTPPTAIFWDYWEAFNDNASGRKIYVPRESVNLYKAADGWKEYADAIEPYDF